MATLAVVRQVWSDTFRPALIMRTTSCKLSYTHTGICGQLVYRQEVSQLWPTCRFAFYSIYYCQQKYLFEKILTRKHALLKSILVHFFEEHKTIQLKYLCRWFHVTL